MTLCPFSEIDVHIWQLSTVVDGGLSELDAHCKDLDVCMYIHTDITIRNIGLEWKYLSYN